MRTKIAIALTILTILILLTSCKGDTPQIRPSDETTTPSVTDAVLTEPPVILPEGIILAGPDMPTVATIVYPAASEEYKTAAEQLAAHVNTSVPTAEITAIPDTEAASTEYEILIGDARSPASPLPEGKSYGAILDGKQLRLVGVDVANTLNAVKYLQLYGFSDGYFVISDVLNYTSGDAAYTVLSQSPEKYYYYEDVYTPTLVYAFAPGVVADGSRISVGGVDVTPSLIWSEGYVTLADYTVPAGDHTVLVGLADAEGDVSIYETTFSCGDGSVMHLYSGEIHAHTTSSDGKGTVEQAYAYARDVAKLDFFSVTDHSDSFTKEEYQNSHIPNADSYNDPGKFVALYGYEQTYSLGTGYYGHLNTINYHTLTTRSMYLERYYETMANDADAVVMFNHPGYKWGNFLEYDSYSELYDSAVNLSEIKGSSYDTEYALALTKGWHVSPMYNEDNHSPNWGNAYEYCSYALAPALTRQNIIDAFNKNRTYTTTDKSLQIYYQINDEWMGARLDAPDTLKVHVELSTNKPGGLGVVYLMTEDNAIVAQQPLGTKKQYTWDIELDALYDYYYVKVVGTNIWCVTAPIWVENRDQLVLSEMSQALIDGTEDTKDHRFTVNVTNTSSAPMTNVEVRFYQAPTSGTSLVRGKAVGTVALGDLAAGQTLAAYADVSYSSSSPRIYATVTAQQNGKSYGAIRYMEFSNIYFSEILPLTMSSGDPSDSYEYIELYNNSDKAIALSNVKIRHYAKPGISNDALAENTWTLRGTIQPHSTLVVWIVSEGSTKTVADFNKHFSTSLKDGRDIIRIVGNNIPHTNPVQFDIVNGSTVVGRCWYNWGIKRNVATNRSIIYTYPTDYTMTAKVSEYRQTPTPGALVQGQMPQLIEK